MLADVDPTALPSSAPLWVYVLAIVVPPLSLIVVAVLSVLLNRRVGRVEVHARQAAASAGVAEEQTANTHETNLREDLDDKFLAVNKRVDGLARSQARIARSLRGIAQRLDAVIDDGAETTED